MFALHSLRPRQCLGWLYLPSARKWLFIADKSWKRAHCRWECTNNSKSTVKLLRQILPHNRSNINNAISSWVSDLQKIRFVFNHLIQYEWGDIGNASDWPMTDSLCITRTLQVSICKCEILNSDPIYPSKKDQNHSIQTQENTVQNTTTLIAFTTSRGQTCVFNEILFFFSRENFRFVRRALQVSKFSPASISVCKQILSPNLFRPGWDGNKASLYLVQCALCSDHVTRESVTCWWVGRRSHAVGHVAGALAHVSDLTDVTQTDSYASSGAAVRHRTYQLPPESTNTDSV